MKLTRHNGRAGRNGAYNPKHNDRNFHIGNSEHIDEERARQNVYWDLSQGFHFPEDREQEDKVVYSFEQVEKAFYDNRYSAFCEGQHERNRKTGHSSRDRTPDDLRLDKKTCPEESLIQIGTMEQSVPPEVLIQVASDFFAEFDRRFGKHIHILNWSLHLDEATPHIHERHVFDCENRYGETAPQQEKALEALGFTRPDPEKKPGRLNNRKVSFDAACRAMLFDICAQHGLRLDEEVTYGGRSYLEKQDYILMKQKEKMAAQDEMIVSKENALKSLTVRIGDTERFVDEVADAAYEKAVEVVSDTVRREVRNADFDIIADKREEVLRDPRLGDHFKKYIGRVFLDMMNRFRGMTQHITDQLAAIFRNPEKKEELVEPVRESIRKQLERAKREGGGADAQWREEKKQPRIRRQHELER